MNMKKFFSIFLFIMFVLGVASIAEEITLTTYYPAPYGAYNELTTTGNTYLATISGKVGIGTTAPQEELHLRSNENFAPILLIENSQTTGVEGDPGIRIKSRITDFTLFANDEIEQFQICDETAESWPANVRLHIGGDGRVGICTMDPQATLDVNGTIAVSGTPGASGSFLSGDGKTVTVTNGIITNIQ
jgi:hypothetical protein